MRSNSRSGCSNSISKHTKISSIMPNSLPAISNSKRWLRSFLNDTVKLNSTPIAIGAIQIYSRECKLYLFFAPESYLDDIMYLCRVQPNWPILGKRKTVTTSCACLTKEQDANSGLPTRGKVGCGFNALNISLHNNRNSCVKVTKASRRNHLRFETS